MNWQAVCLKAITDDLTTLHGLLYTSLTLQWNPTQHTLQQSTETHQSNLKLQHVWPLCYRPQGDINMHTMGNIKDSTNQYTVNTVGVRQCNPLQCHELSTQQHNVTSQLLLQVLKKMTSDIYFVLPGGEDSKWYWCHQHHSQWHQENQWHHVAATWEQRT